MLRQGRGKRDAVGRRCCLQTLDDKGPKRDAVGRGVLPAPQSVAAGEPHFGEAGPGRAREAGGRDRAGLAQEDIQPGEGIWVDDLDQHGIEHAFRVIRPAEA